MAMCEQSHIYDVDGWVGQDTHWLVLQHNLIQLQLSTGIMRNRKMLLTIYWCL